VVLLYPPESTPFIPVALLFTLAHLMRSTSPGWSLRHANMETPPAGETKAGFMTEAHVTVLGLRGVRIYGFSQSLYAAIALET
jgi:hypothetical protein